MNVMQKEIVQFGLNWVQAPVPVQLPLEYYCETRDLFQARLDKMTNLLLQNKQFPESETYLISALAGEMGNNSFDHNLGNWPDLPGVLFNYDISSDRKLLY